MYKYRWRINTIALRSLDNIVVIVKTYVVDPLKLKNSEIAHESTCDVDSGIWIRVTHARKAAQLISQLISSAVAMKVGDTGSPMTTRQPLYKLQLGTGTESGLIELAYLFNICYTFFNYFLQLFQKS